MIRALAAARLSGSALELLPDVRRPPGPDGKQFRILRIYAHFDPVDKWRAEALDARELIDAF